VRQRVESIYSRRSEEPKACQRKPPEPLALSSSEQLDKGGFARLPTALRPSGPVQQWIFHQAEQELTTLPGLRYSSGHRKGRLKILSPVRFCCGPMLCCRYFTSDANTQMNLVTELPNEPHLEKVSHWRICELIGASLLVIFSVFALYIVADVSVVNAIVNGTPWKPFFLISLTFWLSITVLCIAAGLFAGKKYTVLYLRRFRSDLSQVIINQLRERVAMKVRLITLDDQRIEPLDIPEIWKLLSRLIPALVLLGSIILALYGVRELGKSQSLRYEGYTPYVQRDVLLLLGLWLLHIWTFFILLMAHLFRVRRQTRIKIRSAKELRACGHLVWKLSRWRYRSGLMAPQMTVVSVSHPLWQAAVRDLSCRTEMVIVDVSEPSDALVWEIQHILNTKLPHFFIAERDRLTAWTLPGAIHSSADCNRAIAAMLDNETVIVYSAIENRAVTLRTSLQRALRYSSQRGELPVTRNSPVVERIKNLSGAMAYYGTIMILAVLSGGWLQKILVYSIIESLYPSSR
jgi:hypothetical protein